MAPSFAANPLSGILRSSFSGPDDTSQNQRPPCLPHRPRSPDSPRRRETSQRLKLNVSVKLPRAPTLSGLNLKRSSMEEEVVENSSEARELLVLAHGLQGAVEDFTYLLEELRGTKAATEGKLVVHASRVNTDKTHDGIILGGLRFAEDVREVAKKYSRLETISLIGFSLGGLYVRYAVGHLYDESTGLIAGLKAGKVIIVASPNLGVRNFGVYRFLKGPVSQMSGVVFGETGTQLMLRDEEGLLMAMTTDRNEHGMKFVSGLKAFEKRYLYANLRNDFMVNYGTAALDHTVQTISSADIEEMVGAMEGRENVDEDYDDKGCRICFEKQYSEGDLDEEEEVVEGKEEEVMSRRLKRIGWTVVGVDFPLAWPIAHNRIVAMSRNMIHTWINNGGRRVVHHLVDTFAGDFEEHEPKFRQVVLP